MKVRFRTFGCRLNRAEALEDERNFVAEGWETTDESSKADLVVVRGCSVTARAQRECEKYIASLKIRHPDAIVLTRGCLPGATADSFRPQVPLASGGAVAARKKKPLPFRTARAYLKVQNGCAGGCTFCIVPKFRGKSVSLDFEVLLDRSKRFIEAGYREIVVTGCNLSLYASGGRRLAELIDAIAGIDRGTRVRLGSLEPCAMAAETVRAISENGNICRFLHIPVQSGSDRILKAMKRPYTVCEVENLVKLATDLMPGVAIGCDMMAGFPGESQADFNASADLLKRCRFTNAHSFPYSERPGTPAASFPSPIPKPLRSSRAKHLAAIADAECKAFARTFVGKTVEVLVENEKKCSGWTSEHLPFECCRPGAKGLPKRRELALFSVTEIKNGILRGHPAQP